MEKKLVVESVSEACDAALSTPEGYLVNDISIEPLRRTFLQWLFRGERRWVATITYKKTGLDRPCLRVPRA